MAGAWSTLAGLGAAAAAAAWMLVRAIRDAAHERGLLDHPNERSSHAEPTPRLGGLGLLAAVVGVTGAWVWWTGSDRPALLVVLSVGSAIALVSLLDDLRGLSALSRLVVHMAAAVLTIALLGPLEMPWPLGPGAAPAVAMAVSVLWVGGFINAFNFMDGTDGIAGLQAFVASAAWAAAGWWLGRADVAVLAVAVAGATAAFLFHNWSPAGIFMGDVGSAFLGYLLAVLPLLAEPRATVWIALLPVWPFVVDTTITLIRRAARGESLMTAHRSHLYQRMTAATWTHAGVALLYGALAVPGAVVAVLTLTGAVVSPTAGLTVLALGTMLLTRLTARAEARAARRAGPAPGKDAMLRA
ncbi:MAG: glycosyltransferase family 4 protein [Vicinamibacterales bacterium]